MAKKKTTIYLDEDLAKQAKMQAIAEDKTLTDLIHEGLKKVVKESVTKIIDHRSQISGPTISRMKPNVSDNLDK